MILTVFTRQKTPDKMYLSPQKNQLQILRDDSHKMLKIIFSGWGWGENKKKTHLSSANFSQCAKSFCQIIPYIVLLKLLSGPMK